MARAAVAPGATRGLNCPSCGAAIVLRGMAWTQSVACASCGTVLDARDPQLAILQRADRRMTVKPLIPLGTRGEWRGAPHEVIGMQQRTITVDGTDYSWREYVLFNPYRGFRYLTEYQGHWNDVVAFPAVPVEKKGQDGRPVAEAGGVTYRHFQTAEARTTFVVGEFPWEVRVGDRAEARDYVSPPRILSAESTPEETTWSRGEYVSGAAVWKAFRLPGSAPSAFGVYANQPSPHAGSIASMWMTFGVLALLLVALWIGRGVTARNEVVLSESYQYAPGILTGQGADVTADAGAAFVTRAFDLRGRTSNVVVETSADVDNSWLYVSYALVNEATGTAYDFGREIGYYHGRDADGAWSEGSRRDRARIGSIPPGRYYLRIEPELPPGAAPVGYTVRVRRDVPGVTPWLVGLLLLLVPPVFASLRAGSFEQQRWAESDYAPASSGEDDDDE